VQPTLDEELGAFLPLGLGYFDGRIESRPRGVEPRAYVLREDPVFFCVVVELKNGRLGVSQQCRGRLAAEKG
jgi:hypothetical protein